MSDATKTAEQIAGTLAAALTALSPVLGPAAPAVAALAPELPMLVAAIATAIESGLSGHDALIAGLDARLAAKRAQVDAALAAKHGH